MRRPAVRKIAAAVACLAGLALGRPAQADPPVEDEATSEDSGVVHHRRALELYDAGDYPLALAEFTRAYALSGSFKTLYNIGLVELQLNHPAKAQLALTRYLADGGAAVPEERRADVERDLAKLRLRTAYLTVHVTPPGAHVVVNDVDLGTAPIEHALVDAGSMRLQVSRDGSLSQNRDLALVGGESQTVTFALVDMPALRVEVPAPPARTGGLAIAGWIASGALLASSVGMAIASLHASSDYDRDRNANINESPEQARADLEHERSNVKTLALVTDVLACATVATAGVSLYLTLRDARPRSRTPSLRIQGTSTWLRVPF